jgi:hypothetical protein
MQLWIEQRDLHSKNWKWMTILRSWILSGFVFWSSLPFL